MTKFIAIPVAQGDAFYLKRGDWSALVDGGRSEQSFPGLFTTHVNPDGVEVLVCTHNDADHANGVLGFLRSGLSCREVWLPGRWLDALPGVLESIETVIEILAKEIQSVRVRPEDSEEDISSLEAYAITIDGKHDEKRTENKSLELGDDGWPAECHKKLEQADETGWGSDSLYPIFRYRHRYGYFDLDENRMNLLWSAIDAAKRIREIAKEAFHRGIKVRWFEFYPSAPAGGIADLHPINCREITKIHNTGGVSLLMYLTLSIENKESLVFWSPGEDGQGGVLFTADSDLAGVTTLGPLKNALVTSPHHGSSANANAYVKIKASASNDSTLTWARSDGRYSKRPGNEYLGVAGKRFCTICRHSSTAFSLKQPVFLEYSSSVWGGLNGTYSCECK